MTEGTVKHGETEHSVAFAYTDLASKFSICCFTSAMN
jgi:hypothetical protein